MEAACWILSQSLRISLKPKFLSFFSRGLDLRITPSLSLPRAPHIPPSRLKISVAPPADALFFDFLPSKLHSKFYIEKNSKTNRKNAEQMRKSMILAVPKGSQTVSKTIANRCPKKHVIFETSCDRFLQHLKPRNLENINFP